MSNISHNPSVSGAIAQGVAHIAGAADLITLDLHAAAAVLQAHPETVRIKAKAGELPARKVGKRWIFSSAALQRYLMGEWIPRVVQGDVNKESSCLSTKEVRVPTGITSSTPLVAANRYKEALKPAIKPKRKNSTIA